MIFSLENGLLTTDLDCQFNNLINLGGLDPLPPGLVRDDDPRLSDERIPMDGSVTDIKVAPAAAIVQSKLNLNGVIPPAWLGTTSTKAAKGSDAEYKSNKGVASGYASLDGTGKVPVGQLPALAGTGTVTSVGLALPAAHFTITGSPVTSSGTLTAAWTSILGPCWFGVQLGTANPPAFHTGAIPLGLVPNLPAAQVNSGIFDPARLPVAVYGVGHAKGVIPDPGDATGDPNQYLARDMTFKTTPTSGKVTVIVTTGAGTFAPDAGARALFVELWGGGGGGGGAVAPSGCAAASGGGGGAYGSKWITSPLQGTYNVIVGNGGAGGNLSGGNGSPGGDTSWAGGPFAANGGAGGIGDATGGLGVGVVRVGASGGAPVLSQLGMNGGDGGDSIRWDATHGRSGDGGEGASGGGGAKGRNTEGTGVAGNTYGGGGGGALSYSNAPGFAGGAGAQGVIRITQFF
jgi:hypothetical protein